MLTDNQVSPWKFKIYLAGFAFFLLCLFVIGLFAYLTNPNITAGFALSYIAGLSTIFLPCTLPLAFIIAPIAVNGNPRKSLFMALLFGAGIVMTFSLYGIVFTYGVQITFLSRAGFIAGIVGSALAYVFGLSELGLIKIKIQKLRDYHKVFLLGLLLANIGLSFPNPIFYVLLEHIRNADVFTSGSIMAAYGAGKAVPLVLLAALGILGTSQQCIKKGFVPAKNAAGWGFIFAGAVLFTIKGLFMHSFDDSTVHYAWNNALIALSDGRIGEVETVSSHSVHEASQWLGPYVLVLLLTLPVVLNFYKKRKERRS